MNSSEEQEGVENFINRTGLSRDEALAFLKECEWNLWSALKRWEMEKDEECSSLTPSTSGELPTRLDTPGYAFVLPDFERLAPDFRTFLEKDLIEMSTMRRLEQTNHLNWWFAVGQKLWPLSTTGDGNCLLHAASLGMWGLHDRQLMLRNAVFEMLRRGSRKTALWRRWKWAESHSNQAAGLTLSEEEWNDEWKSVVDLAAPTPRKSDDNSADDVYESLEGIHVFALAHVLRRPIIVVSDTVLRNAAGEELSPISFGGVYLPLECPPEQCHRNPLVLCYDSAHFSPLVSMRMDSSLQQIIPVTNGQKSLLPVHFDVDPGADFTWWRDAEDTALARRIALNDTDRMGLMADYMDIVRLEVRRGSLRRTRPVKNHTSEKEKGMTLAQTGVSVPSNQQEKKRILNEITQQVMRTLRLSPSRPKCKTIDVKCCLADAKTSNFVLAALLNPECHQYMDKMVQNYMKSAKERFKNTNASDGRKRISRSFSASSLAIECIGKNCNQPASQSTNFLCNDCFDRQRTLMMSFSVSNPSALRSLRSTVACKFSTMPLLRCEGEKERVTTDTKKRTLAVVNTDGVMNTCVHAIEDENGITHYVVGPETPIPVVDPLCSL